MKDLAAAEHSLQVLLAWDPCLPSDSPPSDSQTSLIPSLCANSTAGLSTGRKLLNGMYVLAAGLGGSTTDDDSGRNMTRNDEILVSSGGKEDGRVSSHHQGKSSRVVFPQLSHAAMFFMTEELVRSVAIVAEGVLSSPLPPSGL